MHNVSAHTVAGSTLPLVQLNKDEETGNCYNPFEHRKVIHPTTWVNRLLCQCMEYEK